MNISKERYEEFLKHYQWQLLKSPDYRLGQAFLNYFPEISKALVEETESGQPTAGALLECKLYHETNQSQAQKLIDIFREMD